MKSEIILPVSELKTALPALNKLIGRRTTLPVLSHIKIGRNKTGQVRLQATDLDAHATFTLTEKQGGEAMEVLVPVEQLNHALKSSDNQDAVGVVCEGETTKLRYHIGGSVVWRPVNTLPVAEWPPCPEITVDTTPLPPNFGEALKQALTCCSQDETRHVLRGACLDARDGKAHYIVGTNGRFLFSANSFTFPFKEGIIVPDSKFIIGSGLLDEPCHLAIQPVPVKQTKPATKVSAARKEPPPPKYICLQNQRWQFITREIDGQYPNWKQVIPTINGDWTLITLKTPAVEQMLKVIPNLPGEDDITNTVRLRTGTSCLWLEGRNKEDTDWTKIPIADVTITGKPREIALNREYLLPALKFGLNELAFESELTPLVCSQNGKKMVIMPVSLKGPQAHSSAAPGSTPVNPPANPQPQPNNERKTEMAKANTSATNTATVTPAVKTEDKPILATSLLDQIEQVKDSLKNVVRDLTGLTEVVKQAEKDKRASERELESARAVLKKLQQVSI